MAGKYLPWWTKILIIKLSTNKFSPLYFFPFILLPLTTGLSPSHPGLVYPGSFSVHSLIFFLPFSSFLFVFFVLEKYRETLVSTLLTVSSNGQIPVFLEMLRVTSVFLVTLQGSCLFQRWWMNPIWEAHLGLWSSLRFSL